MQICELIAQRRSIKNFTRQPVPVELLEKVLDAGRWAQNHGMTQPWRFTIVGPVTREALAAAHEDARHKILNPREIVAVSQISVPDAFARREDYGAIACAIQNIALAAWSEGLGMLWSTGKVTRDAATAQILGIDPEAEEIVGFLNFGFPDGVPAAPKRRELAEILRRLP